MIKQEIIEKISKYFKLTEYEAEKIYNDIFSIIMTGVKEDNIVDVVNFGEFIIKYNNNKSEGHANGNGYKKTIEFLASTSLEEELNQAVQHETQNSGLEKSEFEKPPGKDLSAEHSVEEELRKKREEILNKITGPILPKPSIHSKEFKEDELHYSRLLHKVREDTSNKEIVPASEEPKSETLETKPEEAETKSDEPVIKQEEPLIKQEEPIIKQEEPVIKQEDSIKNLEELSEEKSEEISSDETADDISGKSFSDYFAEITPDSSSEKSKTPIERTKEEVIPKSAVLLHNEITGSQGSIIPEEPPRKQVQPVMETLHETEHRAEDNSYYIWYKDSEANPTDTQTLTYEYELLYQATKEAEYKSKLRIYVTSFILFFSIVLLLLIFSPVIYKLFFSPEEIQNIENTFQELPEITEQKAVPNVIQENSSPQNQFTVPPPADTNSLKNQQVNKDLEIASEQNKNQNISKEQLNVPPGQKEEKKIQEEPKQQKSLEQAGSNQQKQQTQPSPPESNLEGVTKNNVGWLDEKFKVIYIQLENGKFAIQESAWDSDVKASKRISTVESFGIAGLKGSIIKVDLGAKGIWHRVRFGEFSTLNEARSKAEELRNKERMKLHAMLIMLFLYA